MKTRNLRIKKKNILTHQNTQYSHHSGISSSLNNKQPDDFDYNGQIINSMNNQINNLRKRRRSRRGGGRR